VDSPEDISSKDNRDPLEEWLAEAAWPEPDQGSVERLREHWRCISRRRAGPGAWKLLAAAAAACVLLGVFAWQWRESLLSDESRLPEQTGPDLAASKQQPAESRDDGRETAHAAPEPPASPALVDRPKRSPVWRQKQLLEGAIARLAADPQADVEALCQPLLERKAQCEEQLLWLIPRLEGKQQVAAIGLLGRLGSRRSIPLLTEACCYQGTHAAAVRALARLGDPACLARQARAEKDPGLQEELLASLLARPDEQSLGVYLGFVCDRHTRESALRALTRVEEPPVGLLFGFLHSPQYGQRLAAARVLGCLDDPGVCQQLIAMVLGNVKRQEALVALLASSGEDASQFVAYARRDSALAAAVRAAQFQFCSAFQ
jgi:hypothetical protein